MSLVVTRKHWIPLGLVAAIYLLVLDRAIAHQAPHPTFFPCLGILGAIACAFFAPTIIVRRKHWILFAVLLGMQVFGMAMTTYRAGIHIPAFLWPFVLIGAACVSLATALVIVQLVGVVTPRQQ